MTKASLTFLQDDIWASQSPVNVVEGVTIPFTGTFPWATTVTTGVTAEVYKDGSSTDSASTYMPAGSHTTSGNTLTTKPLTALVPGKYVIVINATVDSVLDVWKVQVNVQKQEQMQG